LFIQYPLSAVLEVVTLIGLAILTISASVIAAPETRAWSFQQFAYKKAGV
jgi:hypothetical protein